MEKENKAHEAKESKAAEKKEHMAKKMGGHGKRSNLNNTYNAKQGIKPGLSDDASFGAKMAAAMKK